MERSERFRLFVEELSRAAPAADDEEARVLLKRILDTIEDRHSGVSYNPLAWKDDGRFYAPEDDFERRSPDASVRLFRSRGHYVLFGRNGAIKIVSARFPIGTPGAEVVLDKPGADGRRCR